MIGFTYKYHVPKLEEWLLLETERVSAKFSPFKIWPNKLKISFFPLGAKIYGIKIVPKEDMRSILAPASIEQASVSLSIIDLFRGRVSISEVEIINPDLILFVRDNRSKNSNPKPFSFRQLANIPVERINVKGLKLRADIQPANLRIKSEDINFSLENRFKSLLVDVNVEDLQTKLYDQDFVMKSLVETRFLLQDKSINISALKIKRDDNYLVGSGILQGDIPKGKINSAKGSLRTFFDLESSLALASRFQMETHLPKATGNISMETTFSYDKGRFPEANFSLKTKDVLLEGFDIGNVTALGSYNSETLRFDRLHLANNSGSLTLNNAIQKTSGNLEFSANAIPNLELTQLLSGLKIPGVPVHLNIKGNLPCKGQIKDFSLKCLGELTGSNLHVWTGEKKSTIVKAVPFNAKGSLEVDLKQVMYNAQLELGDAKGKSDGVISYEKGFDINYETPAIDFKEVTNLVNLSIQGNTSIKGRTWGTSRWAQIDMNLDTNDMWLEDHALGAVKSKLSYKKGKIIFRNIRGRLNSSLYNGIVSIDVLKPSIFLNLQSKYIDLEDVFHSFSRRGKLPFDLTGTGTAKIKAWGPLAFKKLNYNLSAELYRGTLFDESYDEIKGSVTAKSGNVKINELNLTKANSYARFNGSINRDGILNSTVVGTNFRLAESKRIKDWGLNLEGRLDFVMQLTEFILNPDLSIEGNLKEVLIAGEPQEDSKFNINYDDSVFAGTGEFLGKTIYTKFNIPLVKELPFQFKMTAKDWDFVKLFNLVSGTALKRNYRTKISINADLSSPKGGFWTSTGKIVIPEVRVQRNNLLLFNQNPIEFDFKNGIIHARNARIVNDSNHYVELTTTGLTKSNLNAKLAGQFDLGLAAILTPLEDLGGNVNFNINSSGTLDNFKVIGDAFVKNSFARVSGFPHIFEDLNADILFNEKRLLINAANARLAEGQLTGSGRVLFNGFKNLPITINADLSNATLKIPEGVTTQGSASLFIKGQWFPYTLGGTYTIQSGSVEKEFEGGGNTNAKIQPSSFLPRFLNQERFAPLEFDLDVILANPIVFRNSLAEIPISGRTKITGSLDKPKLTGRFDLQSGGRVNYRESEFDLQSGNVTYNNNLPENPNLYVTANTVLESQDINYDITMLLQGPAKNPDIRLTSSPPLEELDIVSLLGFGFTRSKLEEISQDEQTAQTSYQIGSALLASPIGKELKSRFGVDMQISSDLNEENKTEPKLTLKKRINNNFSASASRTLGDAPKTKITGEYKMNNNLSVIGFFETQETPAKDAAKKEDEEDTIGIDLEYKIQFK